MLDGKATHTAETLNKVKGINLLEERRVNPRLSSWKFFAVRQNFPFT
jgi:hypothetical protein